MAVRANWLLAVLLVGVATVFGTGLYLKLTHQPVNWDSLAFTGLFTAVLTAALFRPVEKRK